MGEIFEWNRIALKEKMNSNYSRKTHYYSLKGDITVIFVEEIIIKSNLINLQERRILS